MYCVITDGAAAKAGVQKGDKIIKVSTRLMEKKKRNKSGIIFSSSP